MRESRPAPLRRAIELRSFQYQFFATRARCVAFIISSSWGEREIEPAGLRSEPVSLIPSRRRHRRRSFRTHLGRGKGPAQEAGSRRSAGGVEAGRGVISREHHGVEAGRHMDVRCVLAARRVLGTCRASGARAQHGESHRESHGESHGESGAPSLPAGAGAAPTGAPASARSFSSSPSS